MAPLKAKSLYFLRWLLLLIIPIFWCVLGKFGWLSFLENKLVDWRFQYRGEIEAPVKVVYVDVDTLSLNEIGNMPWNRSYYARVAEALIGEGGARAVGFDLVFSDVGIAESADMRKIVRGNADFGRFLLKNPPVVLAAAYAGRTFLDINNHEKERALPLVATDPRRPQDIEPPEIPGFETSADPDKHKIWNPPNVGLIDTIENGTRLVPAWAPNNTGRTYYHMAFELARLYWGLPPGSLKVQGNRLDFVRPDGSLQASVPLRDGQLIEVNWFTQWRSPLVRHYEFSTLFKVADALVSGDADDKKVAKDFFSEGAFKDAVVLVGPVDPLLQDLAPTSLDEHAVPKVSVHGNLLKTIVSGLYLRYLPAWRGIAWLDYGIVFGLTLVATLLAVAGGARATFAKIMAVLVVALYVAFAFLVFNRTHLVLPIVAPVAAAFSTSFAGLIWQVIDEQKAKGRIKGMFGAYVSPDLVNRMVESEEDPQLGGHEEEITAYFSDIQSFSTFSEKLPPAKLVELMNEYLTACTDIVQAQGGTLDKYIGDAVVAMFGAPIALPDHALRACVATQLVHQKLGELREKWKSEGDKWPEIVWKMQSRIGLNSGRCIIGNMGSRTRFNYTMMGDDVNLAARMESGAKSWGAYTMCTETTKLACEKLGGDRVVFRPLGRIVVKGRSQAVPIHEIVGLKETVTAPARECIEIFSQALEKYYARDWDGALALFAQSRELEPNVPGKTPGVVSNPSLVYLDITEHYKHEPPPANWDGVYVMKEK
ncbi:MAG TPA: adenylate/guanylate cyclase domain-containing protein [Opitutaceae bacterium]|nr:adenylate/guanylate cyclase domain-containing protein [Opitutaceae bacterium]